MAPMVASPFALSARPSLVRLPLQYRSASSRSRCLRFSPPRSTLYPEPARSKINEGTIGLSIADRCGTTIATDTHNSAAKWRTIGDNLIAYGDGDVDCMQTYFDRVHDKFHDEHFVTFQNLMLFNKFEEWTHDGSFIINVRDRLKTESSPDNLLRIEILKDHINQEVTTQSLATVGTGTPFARYVLNKLWNSIECHEFGVNENLRHLILSKAILGAMINDTVSERFSEIIRGSPFEGWRLVSRTRMDELFRDYGPLPCDTYNFSTAMDASNSSLDPDTHLLLPPEIEAFYEAKNRDLLNTILKSFGNCTAIEGSLKTWRVPT